MGILANVFDDQSHHSTGVEYLLIFYPRCSARVLLWILLVAIVADMNTSCNKDKKTGTSLYYCNLAKLAIYKFVSTVRRNKNLYGEY